MYVSACLADACMQCTTKRGTALSNAVATTALSPFMSSADMLQMPNVLMLLPLPATCCVM
jgi:hypothetical protein